MKITHEFNFWSFLRLDVTTLLVGAVAVTSAVTSKELRLQHWRAELYPSQKQTCYLKAYLWQTQSNKSNPKGSCYSVPVQNAWTWFWVQALNVRRPMQSSNKTMKTAEFWAEIQRSFGPRALQFFPLLKISVGVRWQFCNSTMLWSLISRLRPKKQIIFIDPKCKWKEFRGPSRIPTTPGRENSTSWQIPTNQAGTVNYDPYPLRGGVGNLQAWSIHHTDYISMTNSTSVHNRQDLHPSHQHDLTAT